MSSMTSKLFLNGRVHTYGAPRVEESREHLPHPIGYVGLPSRSFEDGPWELRYRRIGEHVRTEEWLEMPQMRKLLGQTEGWIAMKVRDGAIEAAMVYGSQIPLFRILDRALVLREAIMEPLPKAPQNRRKNKEKWF